MAQQFLTPFLIVIGSLLLILIVLVFYVAAQYSSLWLLLLVPLLPVTLLFIVAVVILWFIFRKFTPDMSPPQRKAVKQFTHRVSDYSDLAGTPRPIIAFRIAIDVMRKRPRKYLGELLDTSSELKRDFERVREVFKT